MMSNNSAVGYPGAATEQPRQPGGNPGGGRFATTTRREPDVTLAHLTDDEYNADGTFEYPPIPRSVDQHVAFWSRVQVPDANIARVRAAYVEQWPIWGEAQLDAWAATDPEPIPSTLRPRTQEIEEWGHRFDAESARLLEERPNDLPAVLARPLIRAAQMAKYAKWLETQEEYDRVLATEIDLGEDEPWTVRRCLDVYRLDELEDGAFEDATKYSGINAVLTTQKLTELVDLLREQSGDEA